MGGVLRVSPGSCKSPGENPSFENIRVSQLALARCEGQPRWGPIVLREETMEMDGMEMDGFVRRPGSHATLSSHCVLPSTEWDR